MIKSISCAALLLLLTHGLAGQKFLDFDENPDRPTKVAKHLNEVKAKSRDTSYHQSILPVLPIEGTTDGTLHFPYPIIFVHGLGSSADTWSEFYNQSVEAGWSYGGQLRYHLNMDLDNGYSNIYDNTYSELARFQQEVPVGDFYLVNFNVATDGTPLGKEPNYYLSNQAAIAKQGLALADAIAMVKKACGAEKVILFGHSMGGLASREYIQNEDLWVETNHHSVAKLITSGTPHGGSNMSGGSIVDFFRTGTDEQSDAVRDLRTSYNETNEKGAYLFGGLESKSHIDNNFFNDYYSVDVNCNGVIGEKIVGLNEKSFPSDIDVSVIIGITTADLINLPGDGVVNVVSADLKNFYNLRRESFFVKDQTALFEIHTDLPSEVHTNILALDEPDYYDVPYGVLVNHSYNGYITSQSSDAEYQIDYDDYTFTVEKPGTVEVKLKQSGNLDLQYQVLNAKTLTVIEHTSNGSDKINLQEGEYILEIAAEPSLNSFVSYFFSIDYQEQISTATTDFADQEVTLSPNPADSYVQIEGLPYGNDIDLSVYNLLGQTQSLQLKDGGRLDVSGLIPGMYHVALEGRKVGSFVKN